MEIILLLFENDEEKKTVKERIILQVKLRVYL